MRINDLILAKISGVSYIVGAIVANDMPLIQKVALMIAIVSGGLSIGDKILSFMKKFKGTKNTSVGENSSENNADHEGHQ